MFSYSYRHSLKTSGSLYGHSSAIRGYNYCVIISAPSGLPKEVVIEDKQAQEQLRLISELDTDDRMIIFKMIDKMLTSKKFKDFFSKNVASL